MRATIANCWILTDEHAACSHGLPIVVSSADKSNVYGPMDTFQSGQGEVFTMGGTVAGWANTKSRPKKLKKLAAAFCSQWPNGPQVEL